MLAITEGSNYEYPVNCGTVRIVLNQHGLWWMRQPQDFPELAREERQNRQQNFL